MRALVIVAMLLIASPSVAQSDPDYCEGLVQPTSATATVIGGLEEELAMMPVDNMAQYLKGKEQKAAADFIAAHEALLPALKAYVDRLEDLSYALQQCAR